MFETMVVNYLLIIYGDKFNLSQSEFVRTILNWLQMKLEACQVPEQ